MGHPASAASLGGTEGTRLTPRVRRMQSEQYCPLVGRRGELAALALALDRRQSRLIRGPRGIGKTRLIREALEQAKQPFVSVRQPRVLHQLLVELAAGLRCSVRRPTSIVLKPAVLEALRTAPRAVVLDDVADASPRMYRFLQQIYHMPGCCLIVAARSRACLGHLHKLLWDPREEIALSPLDQREAQALFDAAAQAFGLTALDLTGFRRDVLAAARGNAGQIVAMCRMAARPEYQKNRRVNFPSLRMDALAALVS